MDSYAQRVATADDADAISRMLFDAFGEDVQDDQLEYEREVLEPERCDIIEHDGRIVANAAAYSRDLTVPGGIVPAAHVTMVGVAPTHRRKGLLTRLITHQTRTIAASGREPVAVLWASEARIYQRFGYGLAARHLRMDIDTREVRLPGTPAGTLRAVVPAEVVKDLAGVYEQVRADRPGYSGRDERWWKHLLADPASRRDGASALRALLYEVNGEVTGYALWRHKSEWDAGPAGVVRVRELITTDIGAYLALWQFLMSVDLTRSCVAPFGTVDEPLQYLVNEPRLLRTQLKDALWLRIADLPAALTARRYVAPADAVLEVTDTLLPDNAGRWRVTIDPAGTATVTRTDDEPDVALDIADLGAVYLADARLESLARAGRVRELRPGTLAPLSLAFGWHRPPALVESF